MNVEVINPFLKATINVITTMAFMEVKAGKPYLKKGDNAKGDVTGIIGLTGQTEGSISVSFTQSCIEKILSNMLGEEITGLGEEVKDGVGELTNMISGDARRALSAKGMTLQGSIPTVVSGANHSVTHISKSPTVAIPFETEAGSFTVEVCLKD